MVVSLSVDEVTEFRTAVTGVDVDWVRVDRGWGPAFMVSSGDDRVAVSTGGLDFSTVMHTDIPDGRIGLQFFRRAPNGTRWCGADADDMTLFAHGPTSSLMANVPAGSRAVSVIASIDSLVGIAGELGVPNPDLRSMRGPVRPTPTIRALCNDLMLVADCPELLESASGTTRLLESIAHAVHEPGRTDRPTRRGFDSAGIVTACLDHVAATGDHQPPVSRLCRVAHASESRLRLAFVEVLGMPPSEYFQVRVLSMLRDELVTATPGGSTVTEAATALGLTQLGRVAGRYRALFGETPRDTLLRPRAR